MQLKKIQSSFDFWTNKLIKLLKNFTLKTEKIYFFMREFVFSKKKKIYFILHGTHKSRYTSQTLKPMGQNSEFLQRSMAAFAMSDVK